MELHTNRREITDAQVGDIETFLKEATGEDAFASLIRANGDLFQVVRLKANGLFLMEYGENGRQFKARDNAAADIVERDLKDYFAGGNAWRQAHQWKRILQPWKTRFFALLTVISTILLVVNMALWIYSHCAPIVLVTQQNATLGNYEIRIADGAIMWGRNKMMPPLGMVFWCDGRYWFAEGLWQLGMLPWLWAFYWEIGYESRKARARTCRHCGFRLSKPAPVCPECKKTFVPLSCPNCGYDLRASPDRCPECGKAFPEA